ncbi:unnamed protein product [Vitrella brassicaformis CCMP3155]|uniref:FAD dependent oxidoreductase domain-containing protein n=2 Tax=Vitrella brassicaformis TaxID=1169539 RepID=A0A0G4FFV3_VITBC|nr:unnamed protein product [Vitrella brassicaformis CCMP3155]|mmetsp:Transcript_32713/g.81023  ORF Transcript_32713/g.81023 Transcript_32713/m.81023 type:complete len:596 (+) Transcript_32713:116-1903(+)|eukprot:CEM12102.1 unnamed protein product [Vitrella brassicaformis CCMP3155]
MEAAGVGKGPSEGESDGGVKRERSESGRHCQNAGLQVVIVGGGIVAASIAWNVSLTCSVIVVHDTPVDSVLPVACEDHDTADSRHPRAPQHSISQLSIPGGSDALESPSCYPFGWINSYPPNSHDSRTKFGHNLLSRLATRMWPKFLSLLNLSAGECSYRCGSCLWATDEDSVKLLEESIRLCRDVDYRSTQVSPVDLKDRIGSKVRLNSARLCVHNPDEATVDADVVANRCFQKAKECGATVVRARALRIIIDSDGAVKGVETSKHEVITADVVVIASGVGSEASRLALTAGIRHIPLMPCSDVIVRAQSEDPVNKPLPRLLKDCGCLQKFCLGTDDGRDHRIENYHLRQKADGSIVMARIGRGMDRSSEFLDASIGRQDGSATSANMALTLRRSSSAGGGARIRSAMSATSVLPPTTPSPKRAATTTMQSGGFSPLQPGFRPLGPYCRRHSTSGAGFGRGEARWDAPKMQPLHEEEAQDYSVNVVSPSLLVHDEPEIQHVGRHVLDTWSEDIPELNREDLALSTWIWDRPLVEDGLPIIGWSSHVTNLYLAITQSGVTLAPVIGKLAAPEILSGSTSNELLSPYRMTRFAQKS